MYLSPTSEPGRHTPCIPTPVPMGRSEKLSHKLVKIKVKDIAKTIEDFAPLALQESYDNAGLQIGDPEMAVNAVLVCLDLTEDILREALSRKCNLIVTHHPLIFKGLKHISGATPIERIVEQTLRHRVAVYSAHTNLDSAVDGVSTEMAHIIGMRNLRPLDPTAPGAATGLGTVGDIDPTPTLEFLRKLKEKFEVRGLRYSLESPQIVVHRVAVCGGAGASLIPSAVKAGADVMVTGDLKYHDYTTYGHRIVLADPGHYESELCTMRIFSKVIREAYPECVVYFSEEEHNPIGML